MPRVGRAGAIGAMMALGLSLAGCSSGAGDPADIEAEGTANEEPPSEGSGDSKKSTKDVTGTFSVGDEQFVVEAGRCNYVAVEDDWRVLVEFAEGDAIFDSPASGEIDLDDGQNYAISPKDNGPNIDVGPEGVFGDGEAYIGGGGGEYISVKMDISCHYD